MRVVHCATMRSTSRQDSRLARHERRTYIEHGARGSGSDILVEGIDLDHEHAIVLLVPREVQHVVRRRYLDSITGTSALPRGPCQRATRGNGDDLVLDRVEECQQALLDLVLGGDHVREVAPVVVLRDCRDSEESMVNSERSSEKRLAIHVLAFMVWL